jgi:hypothetical protein
MSGALAGFIAGVLGVEAVAGGVGFSTGVVDDAGAGAGGGAAAEGGDAGAAVPAAPLLGVALLADDVGMLVDAGVGELATAGGLLLEPDAALGFELSLPQPNATTRPRLAIANVTVFDMGHLGVAALSSQSQTVRLICPVRKNHLRIACRSA